MENGEARGHFYKFRVKTVILAITKRIYANTKKKSPHGGEVNTYRLPRVISVSLLHPSVCPFACWLPQILAVNLWSSLYGCMWLGRRRALCQHSSVISTGARGQTAADSPYKIFTTTHETRQHTKHYHFIQNIASTTATATATA